ncbi:hypothetical protein AVEN_115825-1 [Araneus ventricosus]|uniref:Uncharacterized protein n=1 Tax=Araneus ventricosus TaxID=182803 RepID=A0A4Y1ZS07_ARAVE|nr:hypothetical protein AVEN_115825-1 [Araneus ventricosus]
MRRHPAGLPWIRPRGKWPSRGNGYDGPHVVGRGFGYGSSRKLATEGNGDAPHVAGRAGYPEGNGHAAARNGDAPHRVARFGDTTSEEIGRREETAMHRARGCNVAWIPPRKWLPRGNGDAPTVRPVWILSAAEERPPRETASDAISALRLQSRVVCSRYG